MSAGKITAGLFSMTREEFKKELQILTDEGIILTAKSKSLGANLTLVTLEPQDVEWELVSYVVTLSIKDVRKVFNELRVAIEED